MTNPNPSADPSASHPHKAATWDSSGSSSSSNSRRADAARRSLQHFHRSRAAPHSKSNEALQHATGSTGAAGLPVFPGSEWASRAAAKRTRAHAAVAAAEAFNFWDAVDLDPWDRFLARADDALTAFDVPGGPCTEGCSGGVDPQDCTVTWSVTVQANGTTCSSGCRGGVEVQVVTALDGPYEGGAPCPNELGDTRIVSCQGQEPMTGCPCSAADFTVDGTNPYFDAATVVTCGACDGLNNNQACYLSCNSTVAGTTLSGDASITCIAGTWSLPTHFPSCGAGVQTCPAILEDGSLGYVPGGVCDGAEIGDVCAIYCWPGYVPMPLAAPNGVATCTAGGTWSDFLSCTQVQQAETSCPAIALSHFSYANLKDDTPSVCVGAHVGDVCSITCNAGYTISILAEGSATCGFGHTWSNPLSCVPVSTIPQ